MPREPTDAIPRTCRLNTDVPQVTQVLNLTKIHKPEIKCRRHPVTAQETGVLYENTVNMIYTVCVQIMDFFVKVRIKSSSGLNMKTLA